MRKRAGGKDSEDVLRRLDEFLDENVPELSRVLYRLFRDQQDAVTYEELREAALDGYEREILQWQEDYVRFVNTVISPAVLVAMKAGARQFEERLGARLLDDSSRDVVAWLDAHGAEFVTNTTAETRAAIKTILYKGQAEEWTAAKMAQYIRPVIGLTRSDAAANAKYQQHVCDTLLTNHPRMTRESAERKAHEAALKYSAHQHRRRADTIANTELAFAYNRGAHESVRRAMKSGLMGTCVKVWSTAGTERVCSRCISLNGETIGFDEGFDIKGRELYAGMHQTPPAHPRCRCAVKYVEVENPAGAAGTDSNSLTQDEEAAVSRYVGGEAYALNESIRRGEVLTREQAAWANHLDAALEKMPHYSGRLQRSVMFFDEAARDAFLKEHEIGAIVSYSAYTSMSSESRAYNPNGQFQLVVLHSEYGRDIRRYNAGEQEILYPRESRFLVRGVKQKKGGFYKILLEEVSDE